MEANEEKKEMPFLQHLEELRRRIIYCILAIFLFSIISFILSPKILAFVRGPVKELVFINPTEAFMTRVKLSIICGICFAVPFLLYQTWSFVAPGLRFKERKVILPLVLFSTFFLCSVLDSLFS